MDVYTAIRTRRSIRHYKDKYVSEKLVKKILDSGRWAPSFHNMQPWRFIVVRGKAKKNLAEVLKKNRGRELLIMRITLKSGIKIIKNAPVIILVYNKCPFSKKLKKYSRHAASYLEGAVMREIQSVSCAIQNMLIEAHALGLGAVWLGIPKIREKYINKLFKTKDSLMAILAIGYPDESPRPPGRMPINEIASFRR